MLDVTNWLQAISFDRKPWLLLGEGPSFDQFNDVDHPGVLKFGLGNVIRRTAVDVAFVADADVIDACDELGWHECRYLLMPQVPRVGGLPGVVSLDYLAQRMPLLRRLSNEGRLVCVDNHGTSRLVKQSDGCGEIEMAFAVLRRLGIRRLKSLGIDQGRGIARVFRGLMPKQERFADRVAPASPRELGRSAGIEVQSLFDPVQVFIDITRTPAPVWKVLERSIEMNTASSFCIRTICSPDNESVRPVPASPNCHFPRTWLTIPKLCGYQGRAICLRGGMLCLGDLSEVWMTPLKENVALQINRPQCAKRSKGVNTRLQEFPPSIGLFDCEKLGRDVSDCSVSELAGFLSDDGFGESWDGADAVSPVSSNLAYFSERSTYPWRNDRHPLREMWEEAFREQVEAGEISAREVLPLMRSRRLKATLSHLFAGDDVFDAKIRKVARRLAIADYLAMWRHLRRVPRFARRSLGDPAGAFRRVYYGHW